MAKLHTAYIGLGSNVGDGLLTLQVAWQEIGKSKKNTLLNISSPYLSAPVAMESDHWFTNAVGGIETTFTPEELLGFLLHVEAQFGRKREGTGYSDRTLDLDILFYDDLCLEEQILTLPHPHFHQRLFVLQPMVEIAPRYCDPLTGQTMVELEKQLLEEMVQKQRGNQEIVRKQWPQSNI